MVWTVQSNVITSRGYNPLCPRLVFFHFVRYLFIILNTVTRDRQDIYLPNDIPQTLESQDYSTQGFVEDCKVTLLSRRECWLILVSAATL